MFGGCGESIGSRYNFCPYCGDEIFRKQKKEDYGILGEDDALDEFSNLHNSLFKGMNVGIMGKMLENAMKVLEKEMRKEMGKKNSGMERNYELFINGKRINLNLTPQKDSGRKKIFKGPNLPKGELRDFPALSKKEPKTDVRRFSDKVVYEMDMPGVKSERDISISNLENSIEIKAVAKNIAYKKVIPIGFPITSYNFSKGRLVLELGISE
jgi:HSP20 family molecular chaperone IbpA